jgi:hypothetical protein
VDAALLPLDSALATVLRERSDWKLVYHDRVALLFVKTESGKCRPRAAIAKDAGDWSEVDYWLDLGNNADAGQFIWVNP